MSSSQLASAFEENYVYYEILSSGYILSAAMHFSSAAQAMEIRKFDNMAFDDQGDYIQLLVDGAQKVLIDEGKRDLAAKVYRFFAETPPGDKMPLGLIKFEINLA